MALCGCGISGLVTTALVALLLVPGEYFLGRGGGPPSPPPPPPPEPLWRELPPLELYGTAALLLVALGTHLCDFIQRKIMEKRIVKLNRYLGSSVERLRAWDAQEEQLEATLTLVQNATSEYNLLLYLILRQQRCTPGPRPPSNCFFRKGMEDDPLLSPTVEA